MPETGQVSLIQNGNEWDVEWRLHFPSLSVEVDARYSSPVFHFGGDGWYMGMFPNGGLSSGYIDFLLWRTSSTGPPMNVELSFSFKTLNGRKEFKRQLTGVFKRGLFGHEYHEINRFLRRSDFEKRRSEFLSPSGHLTVVCTLKRLDSAGSASNVATADCSHCKETFDAQKISSHERKCRVKCPECSDVILLQDWDGHECQGSRPEGELCKESNPKGKDEDVQLKLAETEKENADIKKELDTYKADKESLLKEKLQLEADLKATRESLAATNRTKSVSVCQHDKILQDFKQLFLKQEDCDVVLTVKGREFHAHKNILAARSPVFASTFRNDMKEKETGIVDIEDCDPSVFPDFLCFLYSGEVDNISEGNVFGLFTAADKYDIPDLRGKCLEFMKENLSVDTFCETLTIALRHCEAELIHLATDFFIKNARKILVTVQWQTFAAENPVQSNELVIKFAESAVVPNT